MSQENVEVVRAVFQEFADNAQVKNVRSGPEVFFPPIVVPA
jgi:hypothetical protein